MDVYDRAYVVLEVLAHRVAELAGLYAEAGVDVTLKDGSSFTWNAESERAIGVSIGLGGAQYTRLLYGTSWAILCVNTQHPMFWLVGRPEVKRIEDLRGKRVAGRPLVGAPGTFTRIIFGKHGLNLVEDCSYQAMPIHNDARLVDMLGSGEVDAVVVSRAPFALERAGHRILTFFGDEFTATATGIAVNQDVLPANDPEALRLVAATRNALARIHEDRELAVQAICDIEPDTSPDDAGQLYDRYIKPYWTRDGRPDRGKAEATLPVIAQQLGVGAERVPTYADLYKIP